MQATRWKFAVAALLTLTLSPWISAQGRDTSMQLVAPDKGWAIGGSGQLFWTADNGSHWKDISPRLKGSGISDVFFSDASHGWVLLSSDNQDDDNHLAFHIASTCDSGETWSVSAVRVPSQKPDELDGHSWLDFVDPLHGWVVLRANSSSAFSWGLLLVTEDGGMNWRELPQVPIAGRPVFVTTEAGWISGNAGGAGVYSTHDGGRSWQGNGPSLEDLAPSLPTRSAYGQMKFTDEKHGFLPIYLTPSGDKEETKGTALALYVTDDGGRAWKRDRVLIDRGAFTATGAALSRIGPNSVLADPATGSDLILALRESEHASRVTLMTIRQGGTTTDASPRVSAENVLWRKGDDVSEISFTSSAHGWARTSLGDLLSTEDGGASWKDINPIPVVRPAITPTSSHKIRARDLGLGPSLLPPPPTTSLHYTERLGFDEHNVASIATMGTWWNSSPFFDIGIYVGGANYCGQWNATHTQCISRPDPGLNASWVSQAQAQGWGFFPLWVGPQAPCVNGTGFGKFTSVNAAAQGTTNADNAAAAIAALGLSHSVVFYDMENYTDDAQHACSTAVRAFLTAWVQEMTVDGFQTTAVYGNPGPAQNDFRQISGLTQAWISATPGANKPPRVTIWGLGSGSNALSDSFWNNRQRAHQFLIDIGSVSAGFVTYGGVSTGQSIDYDVENLQIPGGSGTKQYIWTSTEITGMGLQPEYHVLATGINDVISGTNPKFITNGQVGQIAGYWLEFPLQQDTCKADNGGGRCIYGFVDSSGVLTSFSDPLVP